MLSKLAVRRLTKLADFMDALPAKARKHFDMGTYFDHEGGHSVRSPYAALKKFDCGTVACALGWACMVPEFRRGGLRFNRSGSPTFKGTWGETFFTEGDEEAEFIYNGVFVDDLCEFVRTPKQWAAHCRKFLKANA